MCQMRRVDQEKFCSARYSQFKHISHRAGRYKNTARYIQYISTVIYNKWTLSSQEVCAPQCEGCASRQSCATLPGPVQPDCDSVPNSLTQNVRTRHQFTSISKGAHEDFHEITPKKGAYCQLTQAHVNHPSWHCSFKPCITTPSRSCQWHPQHSTQGPCGVPYSSSP